MKRRNLLKSIGALTIMPLIPALPATAITGGVQSATTATISGQTYKWAEMIVRAHKKCSPGMLERLLKVDAATASALKTQLLEKGVISAQANSFGIHQAVKPLYEGAFVRPSSQISNGLKKANEELDKLMDEEPETEDGISENDSEFKDLDEPIESGDEVETSQENTLSA